MWTNRSIGKFGERMAEKFLRSRGFITIDRNFLTPFGEIDLVTLKDKYIVFVEIKSRMSEQFGEGYESITSIKQKHIIKNCQYYLKRFGLNDRPCRIDAVSVSLDSCLKVKMIKHIISAVELN